MAKFKEKKKRRRGRVRVSPIHLTGKSFAN